MPVKALVRPLHAASAFFAVAASLAGIVCLTVVPARGAPAAGAQASHIVVLNNDAHFPEDPSGTGTNSTTSSMTGTR